MFQLHGHRALITGSNRGIGRALALALAECGADLYVHSRKEDAAARETLKELQARGTRAMHISGDLSNEKTAAELARQMRQGLGMPDILILNASYQIRGKWDQVGKEDFDYQMQVDCFSSLQLIQQCVPFMRENKWGRIVIIGSVQQAKPHPQMIVYAAAKVAQVSMVENLSLQLAEDGITVNNVAPGTIYTDRNVEALSDEAYHEKCRRDIPMGFIGKPEDCVAPVVMLCSEEGRYITGINLYVDGGKHI